jgi:chemotaxis protein CheD
MVTTTASTTESFVVGMGELKVSRISGGVLVCVGIGSCIAICAYDPLTRVGGMAHVVLPRCDGKDGKNPAKYGNLAVPLLIEEMIRQGGAKSRLVVKLAGGAQMTTASGVKNVFNTGERNLAEVMAALEREGIPVVASETGGNKGRTVRFFLETGKVIVTSVGQEPREL